MFRKFQIVAVTCAVGVCLTAVAQAAEGPKLDSSSGGAELALVDLPAASFERSIETHKLRVRYRGLVADARTLEVEPSDEVLSERVATGPELDVAIAELKPKLVKASKREQAEPELGAVAGVSQSTLDAIAACESGGDPTAVNAAGYYGKYQFDTGTWASVGGSGNPADAPEAEQDYRAALLYSQAGSSPWPVCGQ
jgi:soluble lytic murein transglycosylase-like protein